MTRFPLRMAFAAALLTIGVAGVATAQPYAPIPPPRYEAMPPPPRWRSTWQPGHWQWAGRGYVWVSGHYVPWRPMYREYVPGHWASGPRGWVWVPAHW